MSFNDPRHISRVPGSGGGGSSVTVVDSSTIDLTLAGQQITADIKPVGLAAISPEIMLSSFLGNLQVAYLDEILFSIPTDNRINEEVIMVSAGGDVLTSAGEVVLAYPGLIYENNNREIMLDINNNVMSSQREETVRVPDFTLAINGDIMMGIGA